MGNEKKFFIKRFLAMVLAILMLVGVFPLEVFAAVQKPNWDENIEDKNSNYWKLPEKTKPVSISTTDPVKTTSLLYEGNYVNADGDTVIRMVWRHRQTVKSAYWQKVLLRFDKDLYDKIDFEKTVVHGASGDISFENNNAVYTKQLPFYGSNGIIQGSFGSKDIRIPIDLVLKDKANIKSLVKDYLVQTRITNKKEESVLSTSFGNEHTYTSYTTSTILPFKSKLKSPSNRISYEDQEGNIKIYGTSSFATYDDKNQKLTIYYGYQKNDTLTGNDGDQGIQQTFSKEFADLLKEENGSVGRIYLADFNLSPFGRNNGVEILSSSFNSTENGNKYIIAAPDSFKGLTEEEEKKIIRTPSFNNYLTWGAVKNIVRVYTAFEYNIDKDKLEELYKGSGASTEGNYLQSFVANTEYIVSNKNWNKYTYNTTSDKKVDKNEFIKINFDKNLGRNQDIILQIGDMTYSYTGYPYISETDWKGAYKEDSFNVLYYDNIGNNYRVKLPDGMKIPPKTNINVWTRRSADPIGNRNKATISLGTSSVILDSKVAENKHVVVDKSQQLVGILVAKEENLPKVDEVFTDTKNLTGHTKSIQTDLVAKYDNQTESNTDDYTARSTSSSSAEKVSIDGKPYLDNENNQFDGYKFSLSINEFKNSNSESISKFKKDMKISIRSVKPNLVPSDFVNEQVQAKVYFDWNFVDVGDSIPEVVEKIAPLNEKYLGEAGYTANGFEGENRRLVDGVLASHNGEALEGTALAKRQYPTKETEEAKKTKIPVRSNGKVFLGWSTNPNTTQEEFNNLDTIKNETEFNDNSKAYKFDEKTPIYNSKKLYAVWGIVK